MDQVDLKLWKEKHVTNKMQAMGSSHLWQSVSQQQQQQLQLLGCMYFEYPRGILFSRHYIFLVLATTQNGYSLPTLVIPDQQ